MIDFAEVKNSLTEKDIMKALEIMDDEGIDSYNKSDGFDLIHNGKKYPPKEVIRTAVRNKHDDEINGLFGGEPTNRLLINLGFKIYLKDGTLCTPNTRYRTVKRNTNISNKESDFGWIPFYEELASKLLTFKDRRKDLLDIVYEVVARSSALREESLQDRFTDGSRGRLRDICPFTFIAMFNKGLANNNRLDIAKNIAELMDISAQPSDIFDGIPVVDNRNAFFFGYSNNPGRQPDDIDVLWEIFARAIDYAQTQTTDTTAAFIAAYDQAIKRYAVRWNLTMGLYWIRPYAFQTLDGSSREYIESLGINIPNTGHGRMCDAQGYLHVINTLKDRFQDESFPVHSFPELSLTGWRRSQAGQHNEYSAEQPHHHESAGNDPIPDYTVDNIIADGCFLDKSKLQTTLEDLENKKNLILQGPSGTGKTWLARRMAYALLGQKDRDRVHSLQFHPNMSYEDFVRGWRPGESKTLELVDGPFMQMVRKAQELPDKLHVLVIEEINRGNPAQIFGDMLTLLEADKRKEEYGLKLSYGDDIIHIPDNMYLIGTMNIADRSLALVDFALRRRFAFVDLEPMLNDRWQQWVHEQCGVTSEFLRNIRDKITSLNNELSNDSDLGTQFRIGHSYVTPGRKIKNERKWFRQVVLTEIKPLLHEYWFNNDNNVEENVRELLAGIEETE